jgi:hypothetical protein
MSCAAVLCQCIVFAIPFTAIGTFMNSTGNAKPTMGSFVDVKCLFATKARTTLAEPFFALSSVSLFVPFEIALAMECFVTIFMIAEDFLAFD